MKFLLTVIGIWGVADSVWLAIQPEVWSRFWGGYLAYLGKQAVVSRLVAIAEFAFSVILLWSVRQQATKVTIETPFIEEAKVSPGPR